MKRLLFRNILVITIILSTTIFGQNYNDALLLSEPGLYYGARALAMGNSFTSLSNDFSGVLFNPAGIGLIKKTQLSAGMNFNSFNNQTTFFNSINAANANSFTLGQFGIVYPLPTSQGSLVFAIGYNTVKDFNRTMEFDGFNDGSNSMIQDLTGDYNEQIPLTNELKLAYEIRDPQTEQYLRDTTLVNGFLNQSGRIRKEGTIGKWAFASSIELAEGFFIGGTFNILSGSFKSDSDYWEDDTKNKYGSNLELVPGDPSSKDFQSFYLNDIIDWELSGWDGKAGLLYNLKDFFRIGATVKFPSYYTIKEIYYVDAQSNFGTGSEYILSPAINDPIEYEIKTPFEYDLGASVSFLIFTFSGDANIIDYTQMEFTEGFDESYRIERQKEIDDLFRTALNLHAGAEVKIPLLPIFGRIGAMYLQSPYLNDPEEFDKKFLTAGAGIVFADIFSIEAAYAYGWWQDFGDNYGVDISRTYQDITVNNLIVNFTARF